MKNQAQLMIKKPPTKLKTQVNIYSKKDNTSTSVDPKSRFPANANQNNDPSLKKKSPYSPRNQYSNKPYIQPRHEKIQEVKKELAGIKTKASQLNNEQIQQFPLLKSKSSSQYKPKLQKSSLPLQLQSPKLQTEQLKSRVAFYQKQITDLQSKIIRLQIEIKEKENSKINYDYKLDTQKFIEISNLKQELSAASYRERSLTDEKKVLMQNQLYNQKKIEQLELLLIKERKEREREEGSRGKTNGLEDSRANERRLIDRHTEIIRSKEKQIIQLKNLEYQYQERVVELESEVYKLKLMTSQKSFPAPTPETQKQKQNLRHQIQRLNLQLLKQQQKKSILTSESRIQRSSLQKQISNNMKQINSLIDKNQQLQRTLNQQSKSFSEFQNKISTLEQLKGQESRRLVELTIKYSKLEEELLLNKSVLNLNTSNVSKSMQSMSKGKHDDLHPESSSKNSVVEKLHVATKNLESSEKNCHQLEKKLKMNESLLHESNGCIMKMRLQLMNRMFSNYVDSK